MLTLIIILILYYFIFILISLWADSQRKLSLVGSARLFINIFLKVYRRRRAAKTDTSSRLLSELKSDDIFVRERTVSKLGKEKSEKSINALIETALHDEHAQVRLHTVETFLFLLEFLVWLFVYVVLLKAEYCFPFSALTVRHFLKIFDQ